MISKLVGGACLLAVFTCVAGVTYADPTPNPSPLVPGETLDKSNWQKAEGLLPPEILKHYREGGYINKIVDWPIGAYQHAARLRRRDEEQRGPLRDRKPGADHRKVDRQATGVHHRLSVPDHRSQRPQGGVEDPLELLLPHLVLRQLGQRVAGQLDQRDEAAAAHRRSGELSLLRRRARRGPSAEPAELQRPVPHRGQVACRPERHGVADLALPRPGQARLHLGVRAGAAARARRQPGQPLGRLPRLRHEPGRRPVLRRQARGLHLDAEGRDGAAAARGPAQPGREVRRRVARQRGLARQLAGPAFHRLHERQVDGRRLGAGDGSHWRSAPIG